MRTLLITLLLLWSSRVYSQVNYVLNPDFEQYTMCPTGYDEIGKAKFWTSIDSSATPGGLRCFPDYCHTCAENSSNVSMPQAARFWQYPRSGSGASQLLVLFVGPGTYPYQRDYLQGRLYKMLSAGKSYCVRFYVNLGEASPHAIKEISAYLDNGSIDTVSACGFPQTGYTPQVTNSTGIITDTANWSRIEGSFVSNGTERFITIGNFRDNAHTTYSATPVTDWNNGHVASVYLIDDVSVIESDLKADAGSGRHIGLGDSTYIGRPKEVGLECTWSVLGSSTVIGTGAGMWVKPSVTTQYVVTQTLCGVTKKDTVWVGVYGVGVPGVYGEAQQYSLSPNPSNGFVQLSQAVQDERPVAIQVVEATGRLVHAQAAAFNSGKLELDLSALAPGCYFIQVKDRDGNASSLRMLKQ